MTLIMAKYHFNIYPIPADDFSSVRDTLKDYFSEFDPNFPMYHGDAFSDSELKLLIHMLPENTTYLVRRSLDGYKSMYTLYVLPFYSAIGAIHHLINNGLISVDHCIRDVGYYDLKDALADLPYNYHYIVQRYYE